MLFATFFCTAAYAIAVFERAGYYDVQFQGTGLSNALLQKVERVLDQQQVWRYLPPNGLLLWIANPERGAALARGVTQLKSANIFEPERRASQMRDIINTLRTHYARAQKVQQRASVRVDEDGLFALQPSFDHDTATDALVVRLRVFSHNTTADALLRIAQPACRTNIHMMAETTTEFVLGGIHCDDAPRIAADLSRDERIGWVDIQVPHHTMNKWSAATARSGANLVSSSATAIGLNGTGQLLAISDTGVETRTCFFFDPNHAVPTITQQTLPPDTGHRKIRAYWSGVAGDFRDLPSNGGHGTHVSGTALGAALDRTTRTAQFDGVANAARLAVVDLLKPGDGDFLQVPLNVGDTIMRWSYDLGARVHSGSWGSDAGSRYTADEQNLDLFAFKNRNFLIIFAAGNDGPRAASISSPSYGKNVLSVGATMNGIEAVQLAQTPSRQTADYTAEWLSGFSSRGAVTLGLRKPDVVAPGGPYVWSASNTGPISGSCASFEDNLIGLAGTSMATPAVAGSAILLRQYFVQRRYPNAANVKTVATTDPTGSLLRALFVASAQPLLGIYPRQQFVSTQQRIDASGHGRIALSAVLDSPTVQLAVLANEDDFLSLGRLRTWRWCVELIDSATGKNLPVGTDYGQVVVAMSYADYPSTPVSSGGVSLINDLRLSVLDQETRQEFRVNDQNAPEHRSTNERAVVNGGAVRFTVSVTADTLGFGDVQTFSLVLALQRHAPGVSLRISDPTSSGSSCTVCTATQRFDVATRCAVCGNGVVESPGEQCDSSPCCNSTTCQLLPSQTACTIAAVGCQLRGACVSTGCSVDAAKLYTTDAAGACVSAVSVTNGNCIFKTSSQWRFLLRFDRQVFVAANTSTVCCVPLWAAMEQIEFEPLFADLTREYVAARLNSAQSGAVSTGRFLLAAEYARDLLERHCGVGFITADVRTNATTLLTTLRNENSQCIGGTLQAFTPCTSPVRKLSVMSTKLCSGGGTYDVDTDSCQCHSNRQPGEPDCSHLACSGQGASVFDFEQQKDVCLCIDGWTGATCAQCAEPADSVQFARLCLGMPLGLRAEGVPNYVPIVVERASVVYRLNGQFYDSRIPKLPDQLPGDGELDCWCRTNAERLDWRAQSSHADALAASMEQKAVLDAYAARASAALVGQSVISANVYRLQQSGGGASRKLESFVLLLVLGLL